jgi:hypothetical protein
MFNDSKFLIITINSQPQKPSAENPLNIARLIVCAAGANLIVGGNAESPPPRRLKISSARG